MVAKCMHGFEKHLNDLNCEHKPVISWGPNYEMAFSVHLGPRELLVGKRRDNSIEWLGAVKTLVPSVDMEKLQSETDDAAAAE